MKRKIYRGWINQPSTLQQDHKYHGKRGIVVDEFPERPVVHMWFTDGDTHSMDILRTSVCKDTR